MKRHLGWALASVISISAVGAAWAADLPVKAPPPPPPPTWTGFYVGGNFGGAWTANDSFAYTNAFAVPGNLFAQCANAFGPVTFTGFGGPFDISTNCGNSVSMIVGAQIGYNWQVGAAVFGFEADGQWQDLVKHSFVQFGANTTAGAPFGSVATDAAYFRSDIGALGTFRGRIGWTGGPWMIYGTGGLAVGEVSQRLTEVLAPGTTCFGVSGTCQSGSDRTTRWGWTAGVGFEWLLAPNWSVGFEYLYVDLGSSTLTLAPTGGFFINTSTLKVDDREQIVRAKFNYHFNWGTPVVAKY
jgi:outer membrane immunogenic protein